MIDFRISPLISLAHGQKIVGDLLLTRGINLGNPPPWHRLIDFANSAIGGAMTIGMITAFVAYKGQFEQKLMELLETYVNFKLLDVHLERVSDIALAKKEDGLQKPSTGKQLDGRITKKQHMPRD